MKISYEQLKPIADVSAFSVAIAAVVQWLPPLAAAFSIIWLFMQMVMNWDKFIQTFADWFKKGKK